MNKRRWPTRLPMIAAVGLLAFPAPGQTRNHTAANNALLQASHGIAGPNAAAANAALDNGADAGARTTALLMMLQYYPQHEPGEAMVQQQTNRDEENLRQLVQRLLKMGANVDAQDDTGKSALMLALQTADFGLIDMILRQNPRLETIDHLGRTALFAAAGWKETYPTLYDDSRQKQMRDWVRTLIAKGARVNRRDRSGKSPRDLALQAGNKEVAAILRQAAKKHPSSRH